MILLMEFVFSRKLGFKFGAWGKGIWGWGEGVGCREIYLEISGNFPRT